MNTFSFLNPEINDEEIDGETEYRSVKKKIRRLNEKDLLTPEQEEKLRILRILLQEYENRNEGVPEKKPQVEKKKKKKKSNNKEEEEDLLNKEYEKNRDYWKKKEREDLEKELRQEWQKEQRERERKLKEEWEREQRQREQQEREQQEKEQWHREQRENNYNYREHNYTYRKKSPEDKFRENYDIEVPLEIIYLYRKYSTKKYRELALKYHPDKGNKNIEYQKMINNIKDIFK